MPPKRTLNKKRQAKLAFSPVTASSASTANHPSNVRSRAAAVTIDGSPSRPAKRPRLDLRREQGTRQLNDSDSDLPTGDKGLPTPKKSFESYIVTPDKRMLEKSMRQGLPYFSQPHGMFGGSSDNEKIQSSDSSNETSDSEREPAKPLPKKNKKKQAKGRKKRDKIPNESAPSKKSQEESRRNQKQAIVESSDSESDPVTKHTRSAANRFDIEKLSSEEVSDPRPLPPPVPADAQDDPSDSDTMPNTSPPKRARRIGNRRRRLNSFEVPDDDVVMGDSGEAMASRGTRSQRIARTFSDEEEDDENEDVVKTPGRRLIRQKGSGRDRQEQEDLDEDLEFLRSSPPPEKGRLRSNHDKPLNQRQKALEALKKRRASVAGVPSSSATPRRKTTVVLSDSDAESDLEVIKEDDNIGEPAKEEEDTDEIEYDSDVDKESEHRTNAHDIFFENEDDADFIDNHGEDTIGEPAERHLPIQFSHLSSAKPRELFKYAIEWMVQKKINPAFASDDEIYDLTFRKLGDEVKGLADSKFSSSAWTSDFTRALRARPLIDINEISSALRDVMAPHCEACNRKTHTASYSIAFNGQPYDKDTLEPLAGESDSESDSESSSDSDSEPSRDANGKKRARDANGELLPPTSKVFSLGSTCKSNAEIAHTLHHWRYHLNSWVVDYLVRTGHCTPEKLVERDKWSVRKREKYANKIVDEMERTGEIKKLHRAYRDQIDFAMEAKNEYRQGWGRRRG